MPRALPARRVARHHLVLQRQPHRPGRAGAPPQRTSDLVLALLGVVLLGEALSTGLLVGFPLVIVGCWLAATGGRLRPRRPADGELPPIAAA